MALVLALADELSIDRDFALKEMADKVVPDLGVLKTYPVASMRTRFLEFTNGTSANDRHGALNNYYRLGFDKVDRAEDPGVWKTTVVNNRADRIPRSRVFAKILVEDVTADRHYLIGGNLTGLVGYIREALDEQVQNLSLWPSHESTPPQEILEKHARRLRIPMLQDQLEDRLRAMLPRDLGPKREQNLMSTAGDLPAFERDIRSLDSKHSESILRQWASDLEQFEEFVDFRDRLQSATESEHEAFDTEFRSLLVRWFERTLVVVDDYYITGDGLVQLICEDTPPRYLNRILGLQNIKGTGLDFVYRWQSWEQCHDACVALQSRDVGTSRDGLNVLSRFRDFGFLAEEYVHEALEAFTNSGVSQSEGSQAEINLIRSNFQVALARIQELTGTDVLKRRWLKALLDGLESFLDPGDSVKRRKSADRIYKDLVNERIASERAVSELKALIQRQKGGWLARALESVRRRMSTRSEPMDSST